MRMTLRSGRRRARSAGCPGKNSLQLFDAALLYGRHRYAGAAGCYGTRMDERECLVRAQEAEAFSDAADHPDRRRRWDEIAGTYRRLARVAAHLRWVLTQASI